MSSERATAVVGVIPGAGHARRLPSLAGSKEMVPIAGRPAISYLVEHLRACEPDAIRLVTREEKPDLVGWARAEGLEVVLSTPPTVAASILDGSRDLDDHAIVLTGFPDTLWEPRNAFAMLRDEVLEGAEIALGLFETAEPERCDIVDLSPSGDVRGVVVKPSRPEGALTWGCLAARVGALRPMESWQEPGDYFDAVCTTNRIAGVKFPGRYVDIGTPESLAAASNESTR
jgi:NDP-sugar pyrophosphorylase family protein